MRNMRVFRMAIVAVLILAVLACTASCGLLPDLQGEETVTLLVQGNLDALYLRKYDDEYLNLVGSNEEDQEAVYMEGIQSDAEYFAWYWGIIDIDAGEKITDLDEKLRQNIIDLCIQISGQAKYEVQPAAKMKKGSYTVKVLVSPNTIMEVAYEMYENGTYEPLNIFAEKSANVEWEKITEEEYWALSNEYGQIIVDMVKSLLPNVSYGAPKSMVIQVDENEEGKLQMNEDDMVTFNSYVVTYP